MKQRNINMLEGSLADKILIFALPLALTGILQQLFNAADVAIVGQFVGKEAMAAVGCNAPVIGIFVNLFIGISIGANVIISNYTGQKDRRGVSRCVHTAVLMALIFGVFIAVVGEILAAPFMRLLGVPDDIFDLALLYLRIYLLGMPVIFLYNYESNIFRSQGDTRTPLMCLVISGVVNVGLNLFFVLVLGMTTSGVATATVLANLVSSGLMFILLMRRRDMIRLKPAILRINTNEMKRMLRIGVPAGVQGMVFSISNLCVQSAINSLGSDVVAASSAAFNIEIFAFYLVTSFGQAATTFIGQNDGAGNVARCRRVTKLCIVLQVAFTIVISVLMVVFAEQLLRIFNDDPAILEYGAQRITVIISFEILNGLMDIFSGSLRGYGCSLAPAIITLVGVVGSRVVWVFMVFPMHHTFSVLLSIYPISWVITTSILAVTYLIYIKKYKKA